WLDWHVALLSAALDVSGDVDAALALAERAVAAQPHDCSVPAEDDASAVLGGTWNAADWEPLSDPRKIEAFQEWLRGRLRRWTVGKTQEQMWQRYVEEGFRKGAGRSFDDARKS